MPFNTRTHRSESTATQYSPHITRLSILACINKQTKTISVLVSAGCLASEADRYSGVRNPTGEELSEGGGSWGEKGIILHSDLFSQVVLKVARLFCHRPVVCAPVLFSYKSRPRQFIFIFPHVAFLGNGKKGIVQHHFFWIKKEEVLEVLLEGYINLRWSFTKQPRKGNT